MSLPSNEPVLVGTAVTVAVGILAACIPGLPAPLVAGAGSLAAAITACFVRGAVTPVTKPQS